MRFLEIIRNAPIIQVFVVNTTALIKEY